MVKPDRDLFDRVASLLPVPRDRVLFLDDNTINVEGATAAGFVASRARGVDEARRGARRRRRHRSVDITVRARRRDPTRGEVFPESTSSHTSRSASGPSCSTTSTQPSHRRREAVPRVGETLIERPRGPNRRCACASGRARRRTTCAGRVPRPPPLLLVGHTHDRVVHELVAEVRAQRSREARRSRRGRGRRSAWPHPSSDTASYATTRS